MNYIIFLYKVHLGGGLTGILLTPVFATNGIYYNGTYVGGIIFGGNKMAFAVSPRLSPIMLTSNTVEANL